MDRISFCVSRAQEDIHQKEDGNDILSSAISEMIKQFNDKTIVKSTVDALVECISVLANICCNLSFLM